MVDVLLDFQIIAQSRGGYPSKPLFYQQQMHKPYLCQCQQFLSALLICNFKISMENLALGNSSILVFKKQMVLNAYQEYTKTKIEA